MFLFQKDTHKFTKYKPFIQIELLVNLTNSLIKINHSKPKN